MSTTEISRTIVASVSLWIGLVTLGVSQSSAQVYPTQPQPLQDFQTGTETGNPFSNRGGNQSTDVMNLIHRAVLGPSKPAEDFNAEQQTNLDSEAAAFRARQVELLRQPTAAPTTTSVK